MDQLSAGINFSLSAPLVPWDGDPDEFVREIKGTIQVYDYDEDSEEGSEDPETAGTIDLILVQKSEAENHHESLWQVCDCHSGDLEAIYAAMFDTEGEFREELKIEAGFGELLYVDDISIDEKFASTNVRVRAVATAIATFGSHSVVVAHHELLTINEWRELGFVRVAGHPFVFRDTWSKNPYQKKEME